jgi:hypothetical protein
MLWAALPSLTWAQTSGSTATPNKDVAVHCDAGEKIGLALSKLDKTRPNVVNVYGTCQENVVIAGFDDLKIVGKQGATLLAAPPETAYGIEVSASRTVSIETLTMSMTGAKVAMVLSACQDCHIRNVTVDGGMALYAWDGGRANISRLTVTGNTGGWAAIGAWQSVHLSVDDSSFDGGGRWCGLCLGDNATANVRRSVFQHFGTGIAADQGATVTVIEDTTIEKNWCYGLSSSHGRIRVGGATGVVANVRDNASTCWGGGFNMDGGASLSIDHTRVTGNNGGGIKLNHHALASLGDGTVISSNFGPGLEARNASMAVGPYPSQTGEVSGNNWNNGDLVCDSISHINNATQITGAVNNQCPNLHAGDAP